MQVPSSVLTYASDVFGDTNNGLSGTEIVRFFTDKSFDYSVEIPHSTYPFDAPNKRTALLENLKKFSPVQQVEIIEELLEHPKLESLERTAVLKHKIADIKQNNVPSQGIFSNEPAKFLANHPKSQQLYRQALKKFEDCIYQRNCLDDLRLCLETFLHDVLQNAKPIEKQGNDLDAFLAAKGTSPEIRTMFGKLLEQYAIYQNRYVKHDDNVNKDEIGLIFRITHTLIQSIAG